MVATIGTIQLNPFSRKNFHFNRAAATIPVGPSITPSAGLASARRASLVVADETYFSRSRISWSYWSRESSPRAYRSRAMAAAESWCLQPP